MKCPFCHYSDTQVSDSRVAEEKDAIRRRRRCLACERRFTTYERVELDMPMLVKRNGSRVEYEPSKLRASLVLALRKRPVATMDLDMAVTQIEERLLADGRREVPTQFVGELVMTELLRLDKVAYIRYASVYQSFEDTNQFVEVINAMALDKSR